MSLDELARASCVIYVNGRREGTGTLVKDAEVLTAAHVLRREGAVAIQFRDGLSDEPVPVERIPLGADADALDIALLQLPCGSGRPPPARLWPARRLPPETKAFGYPIAEGAAPRGVWLDSTVSGAVGGRVQLDWRDVGSLEGHSGGPVCDKQSGLMAGVLVEGSQAGHFDRMVTLPAIRSVWPSLPRPWLFSGESARLHFTNRAVGQRSIARGGDLFRGRENAVAVVSGWLRAEDGPGVPLVITAQPGAGKSAVLARAVLAIERSERCDGVAFHARRAVVGDLVEAVAAACGLNTPSSWQELAATLAALETQDVLVVAVDALDEAASNYDRAQLRQALRELARLDWLRVAVATRRLSAGDPYRPGTHLYGLGVTAGPTSRSLVDLDADKFFAAEDLTAYASALLAQDGFTRPGPRGGAWERYRQDKELCTRLAQLVAARAGRNYLVVGIAAFHLAEDERVVDPASALFDPSVVPSGIGEALSRYLSSLPAEGGHQVVGLLTALAYARGPGLDDQRWLAFTWALGYEDVKAADLAGLRSSAAADYLLQTSPEPGESVSRLFHQALADELMTGRDQHSDEARLVQLLRNEGGDRGWLASSAYARKYAPSHAIDSGMLHRLVGEPDFLVAVDPAAMRSAVRSTPTSSLQDPVSIYDIALAFLGGEPDVNAVVLELISWAQGNRELSKALSKLHVQRPYKAVGSIRPFDRAMDCFDGHTRAVLAVATLDWPGLDHPAVVTGSSDRTARVWDPREPDRELARFDGHTREVLAVTVLDWPALDHSVVVTASRDGTIRIWDPCQPHRELARFDGAAFGMAPLTWPGLNHPVIVATSPEGMARVWDPHEPGRELARFDGHTGAVIGAAELGWPGLDHPVVVTTSLDRTARIWDPPELSRKLARFDGHAGEVWSVVALGWPGLDHPAVITASSDRTARIWDPYEPGRELARFDAHADQVRGVITLDWPGLDHRVVVTASSDATARVWDPREPGRELARFDGHSDEIRGVTALDWPGLDHQVLVTASSDRTARIWDPRKPDRELARFDGHTGALFGVAVLDWPGLEHQVVVTASGDATARVWDPYEPGRELARFDGHADQVRGVTALDWPGLDHQVLVTASSDRTARIWDPYEPGRELARFDGHADEVRSAASLNWPGLDHLVIVTTSLDGTARIWDPHRPLSELAQLTLLGEGHSVILLGPLNLAVATSRGFLVFRLG